MLLRVRRRGCCCLLACWPLRGSPARRLGRPPRWPPAYRLGSRDSRTGRQGARPPPPSPSAERDSPSAALPLCLVCAVLRPKGQKMGHSSYGHLNLPARSWPAGEQKGTSGAARRRKDQRKEGRTLLREQNLRLTRAAAQEAASALVLDGLEKELTNARWMVESFPPSQQLSSPVFPPQNASGLVRATGWTPADLIGWLNPTRKVQRSRQKQSV